jgi:serine/threonine protein kinase
VAIAPEAQVPPRSTLRAPARLNVFQDLEIQPGDFERRQLLGQGSFGSVHLCVDRRTGWTGAFKTLTSDKLDAQQLEFFQREVEILAKCHHPFLLQMIGFTLNPLGIITDFMVCGSLWDYLRKHPMELSGTVRTNIAIGIADGMRCLHSRKVLHRDLKSGNVLLDSRLLPRVADFGLGKFVEQANAAATQACGTAQWMAPEQLFTKNYSFPVDVYAYGMIL